MSEHRKLIPSGVQLEWTFLDPAYFSQKCTNPRTHYFTKASVSGSEMLQVFNQGNRGIASSSGETWEVQRKFTHRTLKNLSKNGRLEHILQEEVADLCTLLR